MLPAAYMLVVLLLMPSNEASPYVGRYNYSTEREVINSIGVIINLSSRVGKEQEIAMKIALQDVNKNSCTNLTLHLRDSSSESSASTAMKLLHKRKIEALIGTFALPEASILSEFDKRVSNFLIISLTPTAISPSVEMHSSNLFQMANDISIHMQCLAAIIENFQWRKVTVIYEQKNAFFLDAEVLSVLSGLLKSADATIVKQLAFPAIYSSTDPEIIIEQELYRLRSGSNRVFVILHSSLELVTCLFKKANQMGMLEKGFVWIISDEIASLLDSMDSSIIASMQGVIGYQTSYLDNTKSYKEFKIKFMPSYLAKYPHDQGNPNPSLYALRAYDAVQAIAKVRNKVARKSESKAPLSELLMSNFDSLSGNVSFKNGKLATLPNFQIINVVGKSYKVLGFWSSEFGFSKNPPIEMDGLHHVNNISAELNPIYWPGGQQTIPRGWIFGVGNDKPLRIGVPASGVFHPFVNVSIDQTQNRTSITGFAVEVFKTSLRYLPYDLPFELIPHNGSYDELVHQIHRKVFDAAVGDINILQERYRWADFTQPYVKSGLVMVVTEKEDLTKEMWVFMMALERKMWLIIPSMSLFIGFVVWLIERDDSPEFGDGPVSKQVGTIFWFSFTLLVFGQKEAPRSNLAKIVLAPWQFLVLMLTIYYTAALTSLMTVSQLSPSVTDVETLRRENAAVGCNWNSFICPYVVDDLHFRSENVRLMRSIDEYHVGFQKREIKAAFFVTSHAQVFLAKYCKGYTIAGPTYYFGGLSFAFPKGSALSADVSQAILKATEMGEIEMLEKRLISTYNCSASTINNSDTTHVGPNLFSGLFYISGGVASLAFLIKVISTLGKRWRISSLVQEETRRRIYAWASIFLSRLQMHLLC